MPRQDMKGLIVVDMVATTALLRDKVPKDWKLTAWQKGLLISVLTGSLRPGSRLHKAGLRESPICPFCDLEVPEDKEHLLWQCPCWREQRSLSRVKLSLQDFPFELPEREGTPALWYCGIVNEDPELHSGQNYGSIL